MQSDERLARLLSSDCRHAPFDRLAWWQGLVKHCGLRPLVAVASDGPALAVLPLARADGGAAALANWYSFRFRPICSDEARPDEALAAPLLAAMARDLAGKLRHITLSGVPDEDGSATRLVRAFRRGGWLVTREICDTNHYLVVDGRSYADYLAARPGALRTTLKRKSGKLACEVLTSFDERAWLAYEEIYAESWKPEEGKPAFLRAFAEAEGAAGRLRLGVAHAEGKAVAAQMWTVEGGTAWIHKLAHRESARSLSAGTILSAALFRHVIDRDRVATVDFGTGDNPYKRDWMERARPRYRLEMMRPFAPRSWLAMAKWGLRGLARQAKRR